MDVLAWIRRLFIIPILSIAACGGSEEAPPQVIPVQPSSVVFIGDSITLFWIDLTTLVPGSVNAGVGGQTSVQMLERFDKDVLPHHPTVVVIQGGINDIAHTPFPTTNSISEMAIHASAAGAHVLISSVLPAPDALTEASPEIVQAFNNELKGIARTYGYTYIDYYSAMQVDGHQISDLFQEISVHPNERGYAVMWPILQRALIR